MKKGWIIQDGLLIDIESLNFILVDNYESLNVVANYHANTLDGFNYNDCVGVWKIKNKN